MEKNKQSRTKNAECHKKSSETKSTSEIIGNHECVPNVYDFFRVLFVCSAVKDQ